MIGVVVPAHDEQELLGGCLSALAVAARRVGVPVRVVVVADACQDGTADVARRHGAEVLSGSWRCVGAARRAGTEHVLAAGATWLASTDADTLVAPDWLAVQHDLMRQGVAAVAGVVEVHDWGVRPAGLPAAHAALYEDREGHPHVHGACLGLSAQAYRAAGGWPVLAVGEDVALLEAVARSGARVRHSNAVRVSTSARVHIRAAGGFGDFLTALQQQAPSAA